MKYRIKDESNKEMISFLLFWWLILPFGRDSKPFYIQYKKHWWNRWKDYTPNGYLMSFKTHEEAQQYIKQLYENNTER